MRKEVIKRSLQNIGKDDSANKLTHGRPQSTALAVKMAMMKGQVCHVTSSNPLEGNVHEKAGMLLDTHEQTTNVL